MGTIAKVTAGGATHLIASTAYGTCDTAKDVAEKEATIQDSQAFTLFTGVTVHIKFTHHNTATNPTLNVNGTGAKSIYRYGTTAPGTKESTSWQDGSVKSFTYDGTYWQMNDYKSDESETVTITPSTGIKINYSSMGVNGKLVVCSIITKNDYHAGVWKEIGYISKAPTQQVQAPCVNNTYGTFGGIARIETNGKVSVFPQTTDAYGLAFSVAYRTP